MKEEKLENILGIIGLSFFACFVICTVLFAIYMTELKENNGEICKELGYDGYDNKGACIKKVYSEDNYTYTENSYEVDFNKYRISKGEAEE